MSTATRVPETVDLDGDDAKQVLAEVGKRRLLRDAFVRLRAGDGTSHSRSLAFMVSLCLVQGLIVLLGIASFGGYGLTSTVADNLSGAIPGPAGTVLVDTVAQALTTRCAGVIDRVLPGFAGVTPEPVIATVLDELRALHAVHANQKGTQT